jgi:hypothetical protein
MTSRLLLTLLALFTGLSAHAAPAETRAQSARAAEMSAAEALCCDVGEVAAARLAAIPAAISANRDAACRNIADTGLAFPVPAVFTGIDRARE